MSSKALTPYAVAVLAPISGHGALIGEFYDFHHDHSIRAVRASNLHRGEDYFTVWRFETEALAEKFMARFGGERMETAP